MVHPTLQISQTFSINFAPYVDKTVSPTTRNLPAIIILPIFVLFLIIFSIICCCCWDDISCCNGNCCECCDKDTCKNFFIGLLCWLPYILYLIFVYLPCALIESI